MPKVCIVDKEYQADYKIYLVEKPYKEKNEEIIKGGKLIKYANQADVKVFITDKEYKADIKIMHKNLPK